MILLHQWWILDTKGAFLKGESQNNKKIVKSVPEGMEWFYLSDVILKLLKLIYGMKQVAICYWRWASERLKSLGHQLSIADPCMYFLRDKLNHLAIWSLRLDNNFGTGE